MSRLKQQDNNVIVRADGRRLKRVYAYFSEDVEHDLKNHCFRRGEDVSAFVEKAVTQALARFKPVSA